MAKSSGAFAWMPMYWGDYFRDTFRLTTLEHGAYLRLIGSYWVGRKPLPDDDRVLASTAGVKAPEWRRLRPTMVGFFTVAEGVWRHKRIDLELAAAENRSEHGKRGASAKYGSPRTPRALPEDSPEPERAGVGECKSQSQSHTHSQKIEETAVAVAPLVVVVPEKPRRKKSPPALPAEETVLPPALDTPEFRAAWVDWFDYRKSSGLSRWVQATVNEQLTEFAEMGTARAIAAIRHTIRKGWKGIFEPNGNGTSAAPRKSGSAIPATGGEGPQQATVVDRFSGRY